MVKMSINQFSGPAYPWGVAGAAAQVGASKHLDPLQQRIDGTFEGPTKHRKGATKDLLNTAKYDKGPDNPKPNSNLTLIR